MRWARDVEKPRKGLTFKRKVFLWLPLRLKIGGTAIEETRWLEQSEILYVLKNTEGGWEWEASQWVGS